MSCFQGPKGKQVFNWKGTAFLFEIALRTIEKASGWDGRAVGGADGGQVLREGGSVLLSGSDWPYSSVYV